MTSTKRGSSYLNPQEFIAKEADRSSISTGHEDGSIYVPISQFEVSTATNRGSKLETLKEKVNRGWFFIYKSFIFTMLGLNMIGIIYETFTAIVNSSSHILPDLIIIALLIWQSLQLVIEFRAIHYLDKERAEKAVKLIKYFMVAVGVSIITIRMMTLSQLDPSERDLLSNWGIFFKMIGLIAAIELAIYFFFLFGATKVKKILDEISLLRGSQMIQARSSLNSQL